jgi:hypothetical protein
VPASRSGQQVASAVPASHGVEDGERHRHAFIGEAALFGVYQVEPPLHLPLVTRVNSPLETADHGLRDGLEPLGSG